jgi:hypothetical protein
VAETGLTQSALDSAIERERARIGLDLEVRAELANVGGCQTARRFYEHRLTLGPDPDPDASFASSQVRRGIRKARHLGLTAERRTDEAALDAFYDLHLSTRRRLGVPTQPKRFIRSFARLFADGLGFVLLVRDGRQPAAAAVFLVHNGTLTYKYGASDARFLHKRPNNLLFAEAVAWGGRQGLHTLDFGRTDMDNAGLRAFKLAWGAEERTLGYTLLSDRPRVDSVRTPRIVGAAIRRGPRSVGRLVGEAFYRHAG